VVAINTKNLKKGIMSPRTPKQFEDIREERKLLIMQVALELFSNEGYHSTSISKIAGKARISKGLMYNYFDSKEELLKAIIFHGFDDLVQFFDPNQDGVLTTEELIHFIKQSLHLIKNHIAYWRLYFSLIMQAPVLHLFNNELWEMMEPFYTILFSYFKEQGYENPQAEVRFFQSLLDGVALSYVSDPKSYPIDAVEKKIIAIYSKKC